MQNPKLEFFRIKLNHKSGGFRTFRDFMVNNGKATRKQKDSTIFASLYKYVMEKPAKDFEKNDSLKKVVTLIGNKKLNKHFDERPLPKYPACTISGVINGGPFGKVRILGNLSQKDSASEIGATQPVLQYYYIFLYLPLDHDEGFAMVHSDSSEDTITQAFRKYITDLFKLGEYKKPDVRLYVPKHFRSEYKDGAVLKSMTFVNTELSADMEEDDPMKSVASEYEVRITLTPKGDMQANLSFLENFRNFFVKKRFGSKEINRGLDEFDQCTVSTKNEATNSTKTFDWNNRDQELQPAVFLKDRVPINGEGSPVFSELEKYCQELFKNSILPEIRPDKYVRRVDENA